jgi:hypothetical protein
LKEQRLISDSLEYEKEMEKLIKDGKSEKKSPPPSQSSTSSVSPFTVFADFKSNSPPAKGENMNNFGELNKDFQSSPEVDGISKNLLEKFLFLATDFNKEDGDIDETQTEKEDENSESGSKKYQYSLHSVLVHQGVAVAVFFFIFVYLI